MSQHFKGISKISTVLLLGFRVWNNFVFLENLFMMIKDAGCKFGIFKNMNCYHWITTLERHIKLELE